MTPDDIFILAKTGIMVFVVLCCFCAWLHVKAVSE